MFGVMRILKKAIFTFTRSVKIQIFRFAEKHLKIHITVVHYYSPIPNVGKIDPGVYKKINSCTGIDFNSDNQLFQLKSLFPKYLNEYIPPVNTGLSQVDAFILYSFIRGRNPKSIFEIGSGESTKIILSAIGRNKQDGNDCKFTAIEPFPAKFLRDINNNSFTLVDRIVQQVPVESFLDTDMLFIDSSHVSKIDSDVNYEILEIIPRLKIGALVHWHDIMIPGEYSRNWIERQNHFWNESYMVHAFMLHNKDYRVMWASKYMQIMHPDQLRETFTYFAPENPDQQLSSFWVERIQ